MNGVLVASGRNRKFCYGPWSLMVHCSGPAVVAVQPPPPSANKAGGESRSLELQWSDSDATANQNREIQTANISVASPVLLLRFAYEGVGACSCRSPQSKATRRRGGCERRRYAWRFWQFEEGSANRCWTRNRSAPEVFRFAAALLRALGSWHRRRWQRLGSTEAWLCFE